MNHDLAATPGPDVGAAAPVVDVDGGTLECVGLLLLRAHVLAAPPGALLRVSTQDPIAGIDLSAWCALTGHTGLGPHSPAGPEVGTGHPRIVYGVRVEARAWRPHPQRPWRVVSPLRGQDRAARPALPALDRPVVGKER